MSAERRGSSQNKQSFNIRQKAGGLQWDGMAPDIEPQDLPENRPALALNVRYDAGIAARPGLTQVLNLTGAINGAHDHQTGTKIGLFMSGQSRVEFAPETNGWTFGFYNPETTPNFTYVANYNDGYWGPAGGTHSLPFSYGTYGDDLLFSPSVGISGQDDESPYLHKYTSDATLQQSRLLLLPSGFDYISAIKEHEGVALIALAGDVDFGATDCAIFAYDGKTFTLVKSGIKMVTSIITYRNYAIAFTADGGYVRTAAGAWSGPFAITAGVSYQDRVWSGAGAGNGMNYFDSTFTVTNVPGVTVGSGAGTVTGPCVFGGYLYFVVDGIQIGRYDGITWDPLIKDFDAQFPGANPGGMCSYNGCLTVGTDPVYSSPGENVGGEWTTNALSPTPDRGVGGTVVY